MVEHNESEYTKIRSCCCFKKNDEISIRFQYEFKLEKSEKETTTKTEDLYPPRADELCGVQVEATNHKTCHCSIDGIVEDDNVAVECTNGFTNSTTNGY